MKLRPYLLFAALGIFGTVSFAELPVETPLTPTYEGTIGLVSEQRMSVVIDDISFYLTNHTVIRRPDGDITSFSTLRKGQRIRVGFTADDSGHLELTNVWIEE
jgi:hypothetical protein